MYVIQFTKTSSGLAWLSNTDLFRQSGSCIASVDVITGKRNAYTKTKHAQREWTERGQRELEAWATG